MDDCLCRGTTGFNFHGTVDARYNGDANNGESRYTGDFSGDDYLQNSGISRLSRYTGVLQVDRNLRYIERGLYFGDLIGNRSNFIDFHCFMGFELSILVGFSSFR